MGGKWLQVESSVMPWKLLSGALITSLKLIPIPMSSMERCGKSTYLQQGRLIVILAQVGYIPARFATIRVVDRIFTRMGTLDNLESNSSTPNQLGWPTHVGISPDPTPHVYLPKVDISDLCPYILRSFGN
ncbi:hypothetical protein ACSBR2_017557 [Camellia fascicularis]